MKTLLATTLVLMTSGLHAVDSTLDLRNTEGKGIGYNVGYTTADYFLMQNWTETELLFNARGHVFNNGNFASNLGLGARFEVFEDRLIGINAFYDFREHNKLFANQLGAGMEYLSKRVDVRLNGYLPVGKKADTDEKRFEQFAGSEIVVHQKLHAALPLIELEVGAPIAKIAYVAAGPYYLFSKQVRGVDMGQGWGGRVRFSCDLGKYITIGGSLTYDAVFKTGGTGFISLHIPLGHKDKEQEENLSRNLRSVPIYRNEIIPIERKRRDVSLYEGEHEASVLHVVFVNNAFDGVGEGTFEAPFISLKEAENNSEPGDIIYVFPGDHTPKNMAEGIILKEDQILVSSASTIQIEDVIIPPLTPNDYPIITNIQDTLPVVSNPGKSNLSGFIILEPWEAFFHNWDYSFLVPSPSSISDISLPEWKDISHGIKDDLNNNNNNNNNNNQGSVSETQGPAVPDTDHDTTNVSDLDSDFGDLDLTPFDPND